MCGRYTLTVTMEELMLRYLVQDATIIHYAPNYNVAPMQNIPAVIGSSSGNRLGELRWGLVPAWSKDPLCGSRMINLRAETVAAKPSFQHLLSSRRCIIPVDGFYEWCKSGSVKQPMRIVMQDNSIFSLAGIYDTWVDSQGSKLNTCSIITTEASHLLAPIHHRMPVILDRDTEVQWLDRSQRDPAALVRLLRPYPAEPMRAYAVSRAVGNVRNNSKELLEPYQQQQQKPPAEASGHIRKPL
ncbi:putative SOS response-associated peptidase YoqW [Paenibacillus albidus]|uniref:Abasic site processing protein n=1 Tax=Paenibacillus albidus TaxID=2041023 RepID=A0A917FB27_9BACL|nr:SOS response-associated peptidase [Paenibacillus albidus]GGF63890.1 putative SOS response-associated peptidase YoqW [Paenibacillus albidus]